MNYKYRLRIDFLSVTKRNELRRMLTDSIGWTNEQRWLLWNEGNSTTVFGFVNEKDAMYARMLFPNNTTYEYAEWLD